MNGDTCRVKPGRWGLYIHHDCPAHKYDAFPEYIPGTFENRDKEKAADVPTSAACRNHPHKEKS